MSSLKHLDVSNNSLRGSIPDSLGNLSLLESLGLSYNQLSGSIPNSLGNLSLLESLGLSYNQLNGTLPSSFSRLSSLMYLSADGNAFSLGITSLALPSSLQYLSLSLDGQVISETFFYNLTNLDDLYLSNCVHNISTSWIPPFQLTWLSMISCKLDGRIPSWISTQFSLVELKLVDNNLTGEIPSWVLGMNLLSINLTTNHLQGQLLPEAAGGNPLTLLDLSRNELSGQIPSIWPPNIKVLLLNDNLLTGNIPSNIQGISSHSPPPISTSDNGEEQSEESVWYDIGVGLSFVAGFTTVLVLIVLKQKYFEGVDKILKILFPCIRNLTL